MSLAHHYAATTTTTRKGLQEEKDDDDELSLAEIMSLKASISFDNTVKSKHMSKNNDHSHSKGACKQSLSSMQPVTNQSPPMDQDWLYYQKQLHQNELIYHQQHMQSTFYQLQYLQHQQMLAMMAMRHSSSSISTSSSSSSSSGRSSLSSISSVRSNIGHQQQPQLQTQHRHKRPSFLSSSSYQQQQQQQPQKWQPSPSSSTASTTSRKGRKNRHSRRNSNSSTCSKISASYSIVSTNSDAASNQGRLPMTAEAPKRRQSLSKRIKKVFGLTDQSTNTSASSPCSSIPESKEEEELTAAVEDLHLSTLFKSQSVPPTLNLSSVSSQQRRSKDDHKKQGSRACLSASSSSVVSFAATSQPSLHSNISSVSSSSSKKSLSFDPIIQLHETFSAAEYDRRCDTDVTCQKLTPALALKIKEELNLFKLNDMTVHSDSKQFTHFFM